MTDIHRMGNNGSEPSDGLRKKTTIVLGGVLFAALYAMGSQIDANGTCELTTTLWRFLIAFPAAIAVLYGLFEHVFSNVVCRTGKPGGNERFRVFGAWMLLFACYVPLFLIVYPGSFTYDSMKQVHQVASGEYSTILPLLHTLLLRFCLSFYDVFQSIEMCGAIFSVIQMALISGCFALVCASISRTVSRRAARGSVAFFALYPAHMAFASNCTKDGLFGATMVLFLTLSIERLYTEEFPVRRSVMWLVSGVLACMLRSNLMLAFVCWALLLLLWKRSFIRYAGYTILILALSYGGNALLAALTGAQSGPIKEILSVPVQQLARARLESPQSFTGDQMALMDSMFITQADMEAFYQTYEPTLADPIKDALDNEQVLSHLPDLLALWLSVGRSCPGVYLDAFLNLAHTSLYPYSAYRVARGYIDIGSGSALTAPYGMPQLTPPSLFAGIRSWLQAQLATGLDDVPVLRWIFNSGLIYWLMLVIVLYEIYAGEWGRAVVLMLPVCLWGTYLMGPVMYGRYLYPFVCALPLFMLRPTTRKPERVL